MKESAEKELQCYLAPWVVPVAAPVIRNGGVVTAGGRIVAVGSQQYLGEWYPNALVSRHSGVLLPGMVNSHCHLELSCFTQVGPPGPSESFTAWIRRLISLRGQGVSLPEIAEAYRLGCQELFAGGCICCGDIGNLELSAGQMSGTRLQIVRMLERLAPTADDFLGLKEDLRSAPPKKHLVGHSVYTTSPEALKMLKQRCQSQGQIFSLHAAESSDEQRFVEHLAGPMRQLLEERGKWDGSFNGPLPDLKGLVHYLDQLRLLDESTLLVHGVHLRSADIELLAKRKVWLCLCPGSNSYLKVGRAPVAELLSRGVRLCLGTDSLASNEKLDLWEEMAILSRQQHPLSAEAVLTMATLGGARALNKAAELGSLETGKIARFLHVNSEPIAKVTSDGELLAVLVSGGKPESIEWLDASAQ